MKRQIGLRLRFNLILIPIVAVGLAAIVWADYRHEFTTLLAAHALHSAPVGSAAPPGPLEAGTLPNVVARRSLKMHAIYGSAVLVLLVLAVNLTLTLLVLRPISAVRQRMAVMERGHWRGPVAPGTGDELGQLSEAFQRLGLGIDALVSHILQAERLATLALLSKRLQAQIEPEVGTISRVAAALVAEKREATLPAEAGSYTASAEELGRAAANILRAVHASDRAFDRSTALRASDKQEGPLPRAS